jgi:hypothetical protein
MARTKQTAFKSELAQQRALLEATPPSNKRPREEEEEEEKEDGPSTKKARLDAPAPLFYVIMEAAETHDAMAMNVVKVDESGREAFEALVAESRDVDERYQRAYTAHILELLDHGELHDYENDGTEEIFSRWSELTSKYHVTCTHYSSYVSYKQDWIHDVAGVFWICNWY